MIEIPNLEQPSYGEQELNQLQTQFNRLSVDNDHPQDELSSDNPIRSGLNSDLELLLQADKLRLSTHAGLDLPIDFGQKISQPPAKFHNIANVTSHSRVAADLYFLGQHKAVNELEKEGGPLGREYIEIGPGRLANITAESRVLGLAYQQHFDKRTPTNGVELSSAQPGGRLNKQKHNNTSSFNRLLPEDEELYKNSRAFMILPNDNNDASESSLGLSDYARELEIDPQEVKYSRATAVYMSPPKNGTHLINRAVVTAPPDIDAEAVMETVSDVDLVTVSPKQLRKHELTITNIDNMPTPLRSSLSQEFASPRKATVNYMEPSPQLPPPLSTKSLKQAFAQFQEFSNIRKGLATELKNPAEYTLHIVFTQFVHHAERKLNLCLDYPLLEEPPIIEILAEGVDPQFDNIVSSLGYIAKRKPKPVIDSVMFWRKAKSEVAARAAAEVEKIISLPQESLSRWSKNTTAAGSSAELVVQKGPQSKVKRSLSLMRSRSLSKMTHRRNQSASILSESPRSVSKLSLDQSSKTATNNIEATRQKQYYEEQIAHAQETAVQAERKSLASIYILCRVLIEVVKQTSRDTMGDNLGGKLEEIVYNQLKTTDPVSASESFVRLANWNLFAELLGFMSEKRFLSVSDRFIADLEKVPANVKHEDEPSLHLLIHGMRYIKLTNYHLDKFEESAEFIQSLTKFFSYTENQTLTFAYAEVLSNLILPLASILTVEANHPIWVEAVNKIYVKAHRLWSISNSTYYSGNASTISLAPLNGQIMPSNAWDTSLILMTSALSVAPRELFADNWFLIIEDNANKLKPKGDTGVKTKLMICLSRLLWVYINRLPDTLNNTIKKLDSLFDILFFGPNVTGKKQQWISPDVNLLNALSELIRIVGFQHFNYVLENVILRLLKSSFRDTLENMYTEKVTLVVKSYMLCLQDYKTGSKPDFPTDEILDERYAEYMWSYERAGTNPVEVKLDAITQRKNRIMFDYKHIKNQATHEDICRTFASLLKLLDNQCGMPNWTTEEGSMASAAYSKPLSSFSSFHFGQESSTLSSRDVQIELFACLLGASSWSIIPLTNENSGNTVVGIQFKTVVGILVRNAIHSNAIISAAAVSALGKLAAKKNAGNFLLTYARIAFRLTEKPGLTYESEYFNSENFVKLLKIYVGLLKCWLSQFSEDESIPDKQEDNDHLMSNDVLNDLYQINHKASDLTNLEPPSAKLKPYEELEWKTIITVIEEVEGNGLFFLCSNDSRIRLFAISILKIVEQFDQSIYNSTEKELSPADTNSGSGKGHSRSSSKYVADEGTRLIQVMENQDILELIKPSKHELSVPERSRLGKIKNKKGTILKLASSDYGIDSTIWFRIYPKLLDIFFEKCPMPLALCRSIVCVRLVQMHEIVLDFSENFKNNTSSIFGRSASSIPPEVLINQWKLYLIFACCSLTSTNEQKISFPSQPNHGRKKSMPMYIQHQKITSAKSIFRMVLPLLKSLQPMIREAVISGLSSININICKTLAENLPNCMNDWEIQSIKRDRADDRVRIEVVHIMSIITSRFKSESILYSDDLTVANLVSIIKNVKAFLSVQHIQTLPEFQSLRCYFSSFLENVFIGLKDKLDLNRWLPFEARIGCFNFLKEWCGFGDSSGILEDRYALLMNKVLQLKASSTAAAILEIEKNTLQNAALSCMATLCSGTLKQTFNVPGKVAIMSFDIKSVMNWVHEIISSKKEKVQEIGKAALRNILETNINDDDIYQEVLRQCYNPDNTLHVREVYYTNLVKIFLKLKQLDLMPFDIFCLSTFLVGTDNYEIRFAAIKLLKHIELKFLETTSLDHFTESVCCSTMVVYKKVLFEISIKLASEHTKHTVDFISYLTKYFIVVDNTTRKDILACLLPWVQTVELKYLTEDEGKTEIVAESRTPLLVETPRDIDTASSMVLNNLFEITVKFSKKISNEVEALWVALGTNAINFDIICDYIFRNCLERRNACFVSYSRQIIAYLVFSKPDSSYIIGRLIENLQPKAMVPLQPQSRAHSFVEDSQVFPYTADISKLLGNTGKESAFSLGQLSMIFLVDLFRSNNDMIIENLPLLLHVCLSLLDHYFPLVQEQSASLLIHLVHSIAPGNQKSIQVMETLRQKDHQKFLWMYDDLNNYKKGGMTPKKMDLLVRNLLEIFAPTVPNLQTEWSRVSLKWATTCAVRHIACRSFQLFRSLLSFLDQTMLKDMLHRLSNTIADEGIDIQGFAMQILMTLNAITAELDSEKLIDFPQLFWSSVACLSTIHEHEFIETISTMSKFVSKIDLDAPDTISCLTATFPPKWEGRFEGLQQVVLVGLRSATAWDPTIKLLDKLNKLKDSNIIGSGDYRLLTATIANLPRFLHALDQKTITPDVEQACNLISQMAVNCGKASLARILNSLAKYRFRSKKDFLVQTISTIRTSFFPEYEAQTLTILLSFLSNKIPWVKLETLSILKHIFPLVDLQREEFLGVGADLISPLLRLLLTEFAEPALEVIDEAVVISGSQMDKDILRMSLGTTSMKKQYEKIATLFGIPEDSGWAIPMPAMVAANTRNNVHAVFATCGESTVVGELHKDSFAGEAIEFLMDEYHTHRSDNADAQSVGVEEPAASLSNMWAALDDFDSFFTKPSDQRAQIASGNAPNGRSFANRHVGYHAASLSVDTKNSTSSDFTSPIDTVPQVYDKKALVILNRSLARTQSNTSFKSSLADNYGSPTSYNHIESAATKRSYIPFRNSKHAKSKDNYTTPKMNPSAGAFDPSTPSVRTPNRASPPVPYLGSPSASPLESLSPNSMSTEATNRFDVILNGGRKRSRKP